MRKIWGFDSEFLVSGKVRARGDIQTIQFSDGLNSKALPFPLDPENGHTFVLENAEDTKDWILRHHKSLKTVYAFVALCDIGSLHEWLGERAIKAYRRGVQHRATVKYGKARFQIYDAQPLLKSFGFSRLSDCGNFLGIPKLLKPNWLGQRDPQNREEHEYFLKYAARDATVTSRIVKWMIRKYNADPAELPSSGTLARKIFRFPRRLNRKKKTVFMSPFEQYVKQSTFAGRSEGFQTGLTRDVFYNDVGSLYPCSMVAIRALMIKSFKRCRSSDLDYSGKLDITEHEQSQFGWIEGVFRTKNDQWGLPHRGFRNLYMTGDTIYGLFNTFDLGAAHVQVLTASKCWKPIFRSDRSSHDKFTRMLLRKLCGEVDKTEKRYIKAVLNSASGKLGQSHPQPATTSNFLAYNLLLGHSHLIMSRLFDECLKLGSKPLAMDTDSIFSTVDMSGEWFKISDCYGNCVPIKMDVKGSGDLAFFRSKRYILWDKSKPFVFGKNPCFGVHGWRYWIEDYLKLFNGTVTELDTRMNVKHTLLTRIKAAQKLILGHWRTRPEHLDLAKIKELLTADDKRKRTNYDSYQLVMDRKNVSSQAWNIDDYFDSAEWNYLGIKGG